MIELLSSNADLAEAVSRFVLFCKKIFKLQILTMYPTENYFRLQKYLTLFPSALLELHEQSSFVWILRCSGQSISLFWPSDVNKWDANATYWRSTETETRGRCYESKLQIRCIEYGCASLQIWSQVMTYLHLQVQIPIPILIPIPFMYSAAGMGIWNGLCSV